MDAIFILAIFVGRANFFTRQYCSKANSDNFCIAAHLCYFGLVYVNFECSNGWFDDFIDSRRHDEFLGCNWELSLDFFYKLPCQYRDA